MKYKREIFTTLLSFMFIFNAFYSYKIYSEYKKFNQEKNNFYSWQESVEKQILKQEKEIQKNFLEIKKEKEKIKEEWKELKTYKEKIAIREEKINREQNWIKNKIWYFDKKSHKILDDEKYLDIVIDEKNKQFFAIAPVKNNDNYAKILKTVFGYKNWNNLSKEEKEKLIDLTEKINRLDRKYLRKGMKIIVPYTKLALDYSPFEKELKINFLKIADNERDKKIKYFWNDFGDDFGNKFFQEKSQKPYNHILLISLKKQLFGIYKNGILSYWGPVSTSDSEHKTPTGFFINLWQHPNWYSKKYEAEMKNAVNFDPDGYFTHTGALLGGPRSHGCVRMLDKDSKKVYDIALNEIFPIIIIK